MRELMGNFVKTEEKLTTLEMKYMFLLHLQVNFCIFFENRPGLKVISNYRNSKHV